MPRLLENTNFSRILAILASILVISLGLCGVTWMVSSSGAGGQGQLLMGLGMLELLAIVLSFLGFVVTAVLWIVASVVNSFGGGNDDPQKLLDGKDDGTEKDSTE